MVEPRLTPASLLLALVALLFGLDSAETPAAAAAPRSHALWHHNADETGLFLDGYDVVAYHLEGEARRGVAAHEVVDHGLRYRFSSAEHAEAFREDPAHWLPAWGGWCAFIIGTDPAVTGWGARRIPVDPTSFLVEDGRLLLFAKMPGFDARAQWLKGDAEGRMERGDAFWATRDALAEEFPERPAGMHRLAPMETAQFSPLMGSWDAVYTTRVGRSSEATSTVRGTWTMRYGWDGFAVYDDWQQVGALPGNSGPAIRSFDPLKRCWTNHYIPINAPMSAAWHFEGTFDETGLHGLLEQKDPDGTPFQQRIHFRDIERDAFTWSCDRSYDGGTTWIEDWGVGKQTRVRD